MLFKFLSDLDPDSITAWATVALVLVAWRQLWSMTKSQIKSASIQASEKWDTDPILVSCRRKMWGYIYNKKTKPVFENNDYYATILLNYLEDIALGANTKTYDKKIIKNHFKVIMPNYHEKLSILIDDEDEELYSEIKKLINSW